MPRLEFDEFQHFVKLLKKKATKWEEIDRHEHNTEKVAAEQASMAENSKESALFRAIDNDNNHLICIEELCDVEATKALMFDYLDLSNLVHDETYVDLMTEAHKATDKDGSGMLSWEEFLALLFEARNKFNLPEFVQHQV